MSIRVDISGLQEAQEANAKAIAALKPSGAHGRAVQYIVTEAHRRAVYNTPWDRGALRAAHRMWMRRLRARIFIDPGASAEGGARPAEYGPILHRQGMRSGVRGGIRAFYQYTAERDGPQILKEAGRILRKGLP